MAAPLYDSSSSMMKAILYMTTYFVSISREPIGTGILEPPVYRGVFLNIFRYVAIYLKIRFYFTIKYFCRKRKNNLKCHDTLLSH